MPQNLRVCQRCGQCCLNSSPTFQIKDIFLVKDGRIDWSKLYTIRPGEMVWDNLANSHRKIKKELIKIREDKRGGCTFYIKKSSSCSIYENRPSQCVAFFCKDTSDFVKVYNSPKLSRKDIFKDKVLVGLIEKHEEKCSYWEMERLVKSIKGEGEKPVERIIEILRFDTEIRPFVSKRLGINPDFMDLIFGRPMIDTISMFGLKVIRERNGTFFLTSLDHFHLGK